MMGKIRIISFTKAGFGLSDHMAKILESRWEVFQYTTKETVIRENQKVIPVSNGLKKWCESVFFDSDALIFIGACGIAVRTIAPFLRSKAEDPAVLVADELGKNVISLLSGHLGGGNELTEYLAGKLMANPVITTASDVNRRIAIDVWAKKNHLVITDMKLAKAVAAQIVAGEKLPFYCDGNIHGQIPEELMLQYTGHEAKNGGRDAQEHTQNPAVAVSVYTGWESNVLRLVPKAVVMGIGCKKEKNCEEILRQANAVLQQYHIAPESICRIASIDMKAKEPGLIALAEEWSVPFETFSAKELQNVPGEYRASEFVEHITGVDNVCERAAMAALSEEEQSRAEFICRKTAANGVTIALVCREWGVSFE